MHINGRGLSRDKVQQGCNRGSNDMVLQPSFVLCLDRPWARALQPPLIFWMLQGCVITHPEFQIILSRIPDFFQIPRGF
jgi:hypothetical protein